MSSTVGLLTDDLVSINCTVTNPDNWQLLTVWKKHVQSGTMDRIFNVTPDSNVNVIDWTYAARLRVSVAHSTNWLRVTVALTTLYCSDGGQYVCTVASPSGMKQAEGWIDARGKARSIFNILNV